MQPEEIREWLLQWADSLDKAPRSGALHDNPEGQRFLIVSDTLALQIARDARRIACTLEPVNQPAVAGDKRS